MFELVVFILVISIFGYIILTAHWLREEEREHTNLVSAFNNTEFNPTPIENFENAPTLVETLKAPAELVVEVLKNKVERDWKKEPVFVTEEPKIIVQPNPNQPLFAEGSPLNKTKKVIKKKSVSKVKKPVKKKLKKTVDKKVKKK